MLAAQQQIDEVLPELANLIRDTGLDGATGSVITEWLSQLCGMRPTLCAAFRPYVLSKLESMGALPYRRKGNDSLYQFADVLDRLMPPPDTGGDAVPA